MEVCEQVSMVIIIATSNIFFIIFKINSYFNKY